MKLRRILITPLVVASLGACAQDGTSRTFGGVSTGQAVGTLGGAAAGGFLGSQLGSGTGNVAATAGGAVLGALLGGAMATGIEREQQQQAVLAQNRAIVTGEPVAWNTGGDVYGRVTPIRTYETAGRLCREYVHTVYIDGRPRDAQGVACQQPDGTWQIVS